MNAALVRSLVRMGVHVGVNVEHPMSLAAIDDLADRIAQPVIDVLEAGVEHVSEGPSRPFDRRECGYMWRQSEPGCAGGCRCVLNTDVEHGDFSRPPLPPHVCGHGHSKYVEG